MSWPHWCAAKVSSLQGPRRPVQGLGSHPITISVPVKSTSQPARAFSRSWIGTRSRSISSRVYKQSEVVGWLVSLVVVMVMVVVCWGYVESTTLCHYGWLCLSPHAIQMGSSYYYYYYYILGNHSGFLGNPPNHHERHHHHRHSSGNGEEERRGKGR